MTNYVPVRFDRGNERLHAAQRFNCALDDLEFEPFDIDFQQKHVCSVDRQRVDRRDNDLTIRAEFDKSRMRSPVVVGFHEPAPAVHSSHGTVIRRCAHRQFVEVVFKNFIGVRVGFKGNQGRDGR